MPTFVLMHIFIAWQTFYKIVIACTISVRLSTRNTASLCYIMQTFKRYTLDLYCNLIKRQQRQKTNKQTKQTKQREQRTK
jgi:hypothetical protein